MLRLPLGVAVYSWGQTVLPQIIQQVLQSLDPHAMKKAKHSSTHQLSLMRERSINLLTLIFLVTSSSRNNGAGVDGSHQLSEDRHV